MQKTRINHQITAPEIRLINEEGQQIGVMKTSQALQLAVEHDLDLVEIQPLAKPPVVKLIDLAKFKYQQKKLQQQQKKHLKKTEIKTIWISMRISDHDMKIKADKATAFLKENNLVRIELRMKGREQAYPDLAKQQLENFLKLVEVQNRIEVSLKRTGPTFSITIAPSK